MLAHRLGRKKKKPGQENPKLLKARITHLVGPSPSLHPSQQALPENHSRKLKNDKGNRPFETKQNAPKPREN